MTDASGSRSTAWSAPRSVSIFVAAFNEAENLGPTVQTIERAFAETVDEYEIIVVNDGSTDGTRQVAVQQTRRTD